MDKSLEDRSLDASWKDKEQIKGIGEPPIALKELVEKHRPDLVPALPNFWQKFSDLGNLAEDPNRVSIDLDGKDADIIQILMLYYRDTDPVTNQGLILSQSLLFYNDPEPIPISSQGTITDRNIISDALASILIILHLMELLGWHLPK